MERPENETKYEEGKKKGGCVLMAKSCLSSLSWWREKRGLIPLRLLEMQHDEVGLCMCVFE